MADAAKFRLAGTKRYADLSAGDAPIAYQSSHRFIPRGSAPADAKLKRTGDSAAGDLTIESCGRLPLHQPGRSSRPSRSVGIAPPSLARAR